MPSQTRVVWWEYAAWLDCAEKHNHKFILRTPADDTPSFQMETGTDMHEVLAGRLADVENFKAGNTKWLKEYHQRYKQEDIKLSPWDTETYPNPVDIGDSIFVAGRPDAITAEGGPLISPGLIRDTKYKNRRYGIAKDVLQLQWYCLLTGYRAAQLDIIIPPSWERSEWTFERLNFEFTEEQIGKLEEEIRKFVNYDGPIVRNPRSCEYCPYTRHCWDDLAIK
jgi:hypothetical protein